VGFTATPNIVTLLIRQQTAANRRVDRDFYKNFGVENRNILEYDLGKTKQNLAFGADCTKQTQPDNNKDVELLLVISI
jgi:Fe(3+) dicitrate transport protein